MPQSLEIDRIVFCQIEFRLAVQRFFGVIEQVQKDFLQPVGIRLNFEVRLRLDCHLESDLIPLDSQQLADLSEKLLEPTGYTMVEIAARIKKPIYQLLTKHFII